MSLYAITGKPRQGKTYWLSSKIPEWLYELAGEQNRADIHDTDRYDVKDIPVGCIYPNFKLFPGQGALKNYPDRIIGNLHNSDDLANPTKLIFPWYYIQEWNLMNRRGRIVATEAQKYVNSRRWASLSEEAEMKIQMHGHDGLNVYLDLQRFGSLDVVIRDSCELVGVVSMLIGNSDKKGAFTLPYIPWVAKRSQIVWIDPELYERYHAIKNTINPKTGQFYDLDELNFEVSDHEKFWHRKDIYSIYNTHEKPVTYTLTESRIPHVVQWCIDDDCPVHGKNRGKPIIHGRTVKDYEEFEAKYLPA
jgi:hypothetical protein